MIELYFNDANLMPENREEEQYAEAALNSILAGKTADVEMCIQPAFTMLRCTRSCCTIWTTAQRCGSDLS